MRFSDPLHIGAILCGAAAAILALSTFLGLLLPLGVLLLIAGAITLLFTKRLSDPARRFLRTGAIASLAAHALLVLGLLFTQPMGFGRDPDRAVTVNPPAWAAGFMDLYGQIYLILVAALLVFMFFLTWARIERGLGIAGVGVIAVLVALGWTGAPTLAPTPGLSLFAIGFGLIAAASLLPPLRATHHPWTTEPAVHGRSVSAATGNP